MWKIVRGVIDIISQLWRMPAASPRHALDPALVALGAAIRAARLERGISQEELAHRSAIDRSYMSSIERGFQNPGIVSVLRIASAMNTTASQLFAAAGL
jgi:DNA-binding XRE family transcriptional regulator